MIVSFSKNFIFLKAPKTAGTSVEEALSWSCDLSVDIIGNDMASGRPGVNYDKYKFPLVNHSHPSHLIESGAITRAQFDSMSKIATVRNPWEVQVSRWWMDVTKTQTNNQYSYRGLSMKEIEARYLSDFDEWVKRYFDFPNRLINEDHFYFDDGGTGPCFLQEIIHYESVQTDFNRVSVNLGLDQYTLPTYHTHHRRLPDHYSRYYTLETQEIIAHHYKKTIDYFGYKFERQ